MEILYDEAKRQSNIAKHGFDFAELTLEFFIESTIVPVKRGRLMAIGTLSNGIVAVVFAKLGSQGISIISMRKASRKEGRLMGRHKYIPPLTDDEEAEIQRHIASDPDNPEATEEELAQARPFAEVFPDLMESIKRARGRPAIASPKQQISLRLDPEVIEKFKATGKGWQARINEVLKRAKV